MAGKRRREANVVEDRSADTVHPSRKRRLEYSETDAKLASLFNDLADDVKSTRIKAAAELIRTLTDADAVKLDKALTRLIKGLCSSRKAARSGFSVALTEVLRLTPKHATPTSTDGLNLTLSSLINRIVTIATPDVRSNSQERRDYLLGRCFGFKSLIQSQLLFQEDVPLGQWEKVLDYICQLASETLWLRRECGMTLFESLSTLASIKGFDIQYANTVLAKLHQHKLLKTPEGLATWLTATALFPAIDLPKGVWHHNDPLNGKERSVVAKVLRNNSSPAEDESGNTKNTGAAQTTPSFAWQVVLNKLYERRAGEKGHEDVDKFWVEAVDNGLFSSSASTERKALGLQVVTLGIMTAPCELLGIVFSPNVMRCIMNQRAEADRYLHEAAKGPLLQAVARAKAEHEAVPYFLEALLSSKGAIDFDKMTKTKTVEELLKRVKSETQGRCLDVLQSLIENPGTDDQQLANNRRRILADMLLTLVRTTVAEESVETIKGLPVSSLALSLMVKFGYGDSKDPVPISEATREIFRARLISGLNHTMSTRRDKDFKVPENIASKVCAADSTSSSGLRTKADKQVIDVVERSHAILDELSRLDKKNKDKVKPALRAFKALFALSVIQAYNGEADVIGVLEDLEIAYQSWQNNTDASVMLIEILLSFISKPSAVYRKLAQQVFGAFAPQMNEDGLQSMLDILEKKESLAGQQELFDNDDDAEELAGSSDIEGEEDSDVEIIDGEDASDVEVDEGGSDEDEEEDTDDSSEEEQAGGDEEAEFEMKLAEALRTSKAGAEPKEADSDDDSDMDDEQMMALDGHLTTIFKERKKNSNKKKDNRDAKENIVNFKNRVLDLLLIFTKQEHTNVLTLSLILPMITLVKTTTSKQLSEKAFNLLQQYFGACNKSKAFPEPDDDAEALDLLEAVFGEIRSNASKLHSNACSRSSLFLAKILVSKDVENYAKIADMYTELQKEWYTEPKSHIQASVFTEWTSWSIVTKKHQH
ncbi:hypothetical protein AAFC00_001656 [Neodothiora populina]|uniref:DNA polymerase V n=1 Tax=Neodothiora populina TaxID=2781224 RepID=A0ABR3PPQ5_9PEZI